MSGRESDPDDPDDTADANIDFLNGGGGDDTIIAGQDDIVTAGDGGDTIVLGDWITEGSAATLMDFDPQEDSLLMVCDLAGNADPQVEITEDPIFPGVSHVMVNGTEIAAIRSDSPLTADDVMLVDHADATALGLTG